MAVILNIDTSTEACSVALSAEGMILCHYEELQARNHALMLSDMIKACLDHAASHELKLDAVAVSIGPGSYTGLRIGLSEAKGLAYALDIPIIGVNTLMLMAVAVMFSPEAAVDEHTILVPMIDARRMEVYTAAYSLALEPVIAPQPMILDADSYRNLTPASRVLFFGNGSDKAREVIALPSAEFIPGIIPLATDMVALADRAYARREFLDLAYSTPLYLKEFQGTKPKNKI